MSTLHRYIYADLGSLNKDIQKARVDAIDLRSRMQQLGHLPVFNHEEISAHQYFEDVIAKIIEAHEMVDDLMMTYQQYAKENPVSSFKIDEPGKIAKRTKWWAVNFTDANGQVIKTAIVDARTKTQIKLLVKSKLGQMYQNQVIHSAVVEGPYKSMMDASKRKTI